MSGRKLVRVFKTAQFARSARRAGIKDHELCRAILEVIAGQADNLGGGIFKKRIDKNRSRAIVLAKSQDFWVYEYLFAKKDQANINAEDLARLRKLAKAYQGISASSLDELIENKSWTEICDDEA